MTRCVPSVVHGVRCTRLGEEVVGLQLVTET